MSWWGRGLKSLGQNAHHSQFFLGIYYRLDEKEEIGHSLERGGPNNPDVVKRVVLELIYGGGYTSALPPSMVLLRRRRKFPWSPI